jgi:hypothetical protein
MWLVLPGEQSIAFMLTQSSFLWCSMLTSVGAHMQLIPCHLDSCNPIFIIFFSFEPVPSFGKQSINDKYIIVSPSIC